MARMQICGLLAVASMAVAGSASAEGLYFGLSGGLASFDLPSAAAFDSYYVPSVEAEFPGATLDDFTSDIDDTSVAFGFQLGYRWLPYFATEIGYVNFGEARYSADINLTDAVGSFSAPFSARITSSGVTVAALGILPLGQHFEIQGRVGLLFANTRVREKVESTEELEGGRIEHRSSTQEVFAGIGGTWNINDDYSLRLEYQKYMDVGDDAEIPVEGDIDVINFSVLFR
jgi:OOP family OmpA-OmpF porin